MRFPMLKEKILQLYLLRKGQVYGYTAAIVVLVSFAITYFAGGPSVKELVEGRIALEQWKKNPSDQNFAKQMKQAFGKVPGFEKSVQAEVAQVLLVDGQMDKAFPAAGRCIERLKEDSPLHATFAEVSLLI